MRRVWCGGGTGGEAVFERCMMRLFRCPQKSRSHVTRGAMGPHQYPTGRERCVRCTHIPFRQVEIVGDPGAGVAITRKLFTLTLKPCDPIKNDKMHYSHRRVTPMFLQMKWWASHQCFTDRCLKPSDHILYNKKIMANGDCTHLSMSTRMAQECLPSMQIRKPAHSTKL